MRKLFLAVCAFFMVWGCSGMIKTVTAEDLAPNRYVLQRVNGEPFAGQERTPEISFDETLRVSGQVCNRFMGQGILKGGVLTVPEMASTMMLCDDPELNEMEREFLEMLRQGARLRLDGNNLSFRNDLTTYTFVRDAR